MLEYYEVEENDNKSSITSESSRKKMAADGVQIIRPYSPVQKGKEKNNVGNSYKVSTLGSLNTKDKESMMYNHYQAAQNNSFADSSQQSSSNKNGGILPPNIKKLSNNLSKSADKDSLI